MGWGRWWWELIHIQTRHHYGWNMAQSGHVEGNGAGGMLCDCPNLLSHIEVLL